MDIVIWDMPATQVFSVLRFLISQHSEKELPDPIEQKVTDRVMIAMNAMLTMGIKNEH